MTEVHEAITIDAPADEVWRVAGDPGRIAEWVPALAASTLEGEERRCTTQTGDQLVERITERSDDERRYAYEIVEGPMPLRSYRSQLIVDGHEDHSHVTWAAEFEPEVEEAEQELVATVSEIYRTGLEGLRDAVEQPRAA